MVLSLLLKCLVHGVWGPWKEEVVCNALCQDLGVQTEVRTCSYPLHQGDECTRIDQTKTTLDNRLEVREIQCENTELCPGLFKCI